MDQQLMPHCTMTHVSMIFLSLKGGTISPTLDLVHVTHYLFHIEVFAIILQNGGVHRSGEILASHCKQSEFTQLTSADLPTERSYTTSGTHLQGTQLKGYSESLKSALSSSRTLPSTA
jgi:hypothetical protein